MLQYVINNTYHAITKSTPSKLMFGFDLRNHDDYDFSCLTKHLSEIDCDLNNERAKVRELAESATDVVRRYNKEYRDAHRQKPSMYREGDYVLIRDTRSRPGENAKIKPKYKGPYIVNKVLGNNLRHLRHSGI